jgi:GT2 family glycosyltransferase
MKRPAAPLRFSVIVASRGRPASLGRTLRAIRQLDHPSFEVIVVGDPAALGVAHDLGMGWVRAIGFDRPNLSEARNLGLAASAGDVCAFIDDDAVPEPLWLRHHETALTETGAGASVGFVRGPDGIRFQSRLESIDREAETHVEPWEDESSGLPRLAQGRAVKLVGTNMVVRRDVLVRHRGFDPAYAYFLEDSDLSIRLAAADVPVAVAPLAEVHHALAGSERRTKRRVPRTLFDVGRSTAVFLRRHPGADPSEIEARVRKRETARVMRALVRGFCEPRDVAPLLASLDRGWREGLGASLPEPERFSDPERAFLRVEPLPSGGKVLVARYRQRQSAIRTAAAMQDSRVSVFSLSLTPFRHVVRYTEDGVWLHSGGQFHAPGRVFRRFRWCRFASRVREEIARVAKRRGIREVEPGLENRRVTEHNH